MTVDLWGSSRKGSHAGRGFRYQDGVATQLAVWSWRGDLDALRIVPEGLEDVSVERRSGWLHLQAKSRREQRGQFSLPDLSKAWLHLAERLAADPSARAALVLERPLPGTESGLDRALAATASAEVQEAVADAVRDVINPDGFIARIHVVVMQSPVDSAVRLIAEAFGRSPAACVAHEAILRTELGRLADENGVREAADPAAMSMADIARLLDEVTESTDPSLLDEAVRTGSAELVDFMTPVEEEAFYCGVDVVAGHVVAGLPLPRPETDQAARELAARRLAIVAGPSGAGKSALIWLTAFATRHAIRWYRVRRLADADVPALVRLVKAQARATIGFVVDDLGRADRAGFDRLAEELRNYANAQILAACREEDLFIVRTAAYCSPVRPVLRPELAERIWHELRAAGGTDRPGWREAFEASDGLLLEYGYLLTSGARLAQAITAQVVQRVRERRDLELDLLALVSTADAFGAEIDVMKLTASLSADAAAVKQALTRLVDEHLLYEHNGLLGGLHEVRSRHLMQAAHRVPPPSLVDTVCRVIQLISSSALQPFLARLLLDGLVPDNVVIDAIAKRLDRDPALTGLAAVLHALRLVGFRRFTERWRAIAEEEQVAPADMATISFLVLGTADDSFLPDPVRRTVERLRALRWADLRADLLPKIRGVVSNALAATSDVPSAVTVLAALGELGEELVVDSAGLARLANTATLNDVRALLEAAFVLSPNLAISIAEGLGGPAILLERLERDLPWVRDARLRTTNDGRQAAEAKYAYVAASAQPDPHEAVVNLTRWLAALAPTAEVTICRAVDATGQTAGYMGVPVADMAIDRPNLPSLTSVAWNRARARAAVAAVATPTVTDHAAAASHAIKLSVEVTQQMADAFARGQRPARQLVTSAESLADAANGLRPAPIGVEAADPLDKGEWPENDPVVFVARMIANNLLPRLFQHAPVAPLITSIIEQVDEAASLQIWRFLEQAPTAEITALRQVLADLHAVVSELAAPNGASAAVMTAGRAGLPDAAAAARHHAAERARTTLDRLEQSLKAAQFTAQALCRAGKPSAHGWPDNDLLILVDVPSIPVWLRRVQQIADTCRQQAPDRVSFHMAPVRNGKVVASHAVTVITDIFPDDSVKTWPDIDILEEALGDQARKGISALCESSGIIASARGDQIHDVEMAALEAASRQVRDTLQYLEHLASRHPHDQLLGEMLGTYSALAQAVEDEAGSLRQGRPVQQGIAASLIAGIRGAESEVCSTIAGMYAACAEWDADPKDAWLRFQREGAN